MVQCKHWKSRKVGVNIVRELLGIMTSSKADQGIIVTCGAFTPPAKDFAHGNSIKLIEGKELVALISNVQKEPVVQSISQSIEIPICQKCGGKMVKRTARRGKNAGNLFWGCSNFPKCRSIVAYNQ